MHNIDLINLRQVPLSPPPKPNGVLAPPISQDNSLSSPTTTTSRNTISSNSHQNNQDSAVQTQEQIQKQIKKLNESIGPLSTFIKFGVDKNNVFFVSVIDKKNNDIISRFPAAKAESIIQKLKEPIGIIFDTKG